MSDNPYASPFAGANPLPSKTPSTLLLPPAICLIVVSSIWLLLVGVATPSVVLRAYREFSMAQEPQESAQKGGELAGAAMAAGVLILMQVIIIYGATCMIRMRGYSNAMTAAIISVIPICSSCYVVGIPFGIWAIIVLRRPEVRAAFQ